MAESFVLYREPGKSEITLLKGDFVPWTENYWPENSFIVQPWKKSELPECLSIIERSEVEALDFECEHTLSEGVDADFEQFKNLVGFSKTGIIQGDFEKVVVGRSQTEKRGPQTLFEIFQAAVKEYPGAFVYLLNHPNWGCWMGASPEPFVFADEQKVRTGAIAGTLRQDQSGWTMKEEKEQTVVVHFLREILETNGIVDFNISPKKELIQGPVTHLASEFQFEMDPKNFPAFMKQMHPTPAVGGYPQDKSVLFIDRFEGFNRRLFCGWLGFTEKKRLMTWVNIRCLEIGKSHMRFYAGCGINEMSNAVTEWKETESKMNVMRRFCQ